MSAPKINLFCKHSKNQRVIHSLKDFVSRIEVDFSNWVINKLWDMYHEKANMEHESQSKITQILVVWCSLHDLRGPSLHC